MNVLYQASTLIEVLRSITRPQVALLGFRPDMPTVHKLIGFVVVGGWGLLFLWGTVAWIRRREPGSLFWRLLAVLQVLLGIQLIAGIILLATGHHLPSLLHLGYGVVFPVIALVTAHSLARSLEDDFDAYKIFTLAAFIVFGLTLRALTTGLGMP
jgi:hypothetical protein